MRLKDLIEETKTLSTENHLNEPETQDDIHTLHKDISTQGCQVQFPLGPKLLNLNVT